MMLQSTPIRVLCVDDHAFVVEGLHARLKMGRDLEFVGHLPNADNLVAKVKETRANVVLLDIEMPGTDPFEAVQDLSRQHPDARVIILTAYVRDHYVDAAVSAGAWGYLSKGDVPESILDAVRKVARGEFAFGPSVLNRCSPQAKNSRRIPVGPNNKPVSKLQTLTQREQQILRMMGKGMSRVDIAQSLCRSPKTVDAHRSSIMEKMDIHDRVELARYAIREGLVEA